ncbi:hypothetical protein MKX01_005577 [Papaver californicum]|nr:hypothetical protein MKX01_005577 [Papaver californicum]
MLTRLILNTYKKEREGHVEVYTLGSGCGWRGKGTISMTLCRDMAGTYANDAIYWIAEKDVVAFDLVEEDFRSLPFPPGMVNPCQKAEIYGLVALGGHLCLYVDTSRMEIWSLKKRGNKGS